MLLFLESFDKYGPANSNSTAVVALLTAGEWTTATNLALVAPLSATGQAITNSGAMTLTKTLAASVGRIIGGVRFNSSLANNAGIQFQDAGSAQCGIVITSGTGIISLRNGVWASGTIIGSGATPVSANTTHYLEWDITLGNSAAYNVYLNGVSIISGTGDTTATANNTINGIQLLVASGGQGTFDDLYLFDTTGTTNNAALLTSPRIETQFPTGDGAVQFAVGAAILGNSVSRTTGSAYNNGPNGLYVRPFTPAVSCTLNSISLMPGATNASVNWRPVVYADNSGAPGTLMSSGSTVTGITSGTLRTMPLTTPQSLTAGTQYWLGYMQDITVGSSGALSDAGSVGRFGTNTFASGAPTTPTISLTNQPNVLLWGNITTTSNWYSAGQNPAQGNNSYVYEATVGEEDLYTYPALSAPPSAIYAVAVKASVAKSDAGAKTVSVRLKSGAIDSAGTGGSLAPGTSYGWLTSHYPTDPNGGLTTWNPSDLVGGSLSGGNLIFATGTNSGVRTIDRRSTGKYYFEYTGSGWSGAQVCVGVANAAANLSNVAATPNNAGVVLGGGSIFVNGSFVGDLGGSLPNGGTVGIALDYTNSLIWFRIAPSGNWNNSGTANPATGAGGFLVASIMAAGLYGLAASPYAAGNVTANFGASAFVGTIPSGFTAGSLLVWTLSALNAAQAGVKVES